MWGVRKARSGRLRPSDGQSCLSRSESPVLGLPRSACAPGTAEGFCSQPLGLRQRVGCPVLNIPNPMPGEGHPEGRLSA